MAKARRESRRKRNTRSVRYLNYLLGLLIVAVLVFVGLIVYSVFFEKPVPRSPEEQAYYLALHKVKENPNNAYYLQLLAEAEADLGKNEEALKHLKQAAELSPYRPMIHYDMGVIYLKLGDEKKALEAFQEELKITDNMNELAWYEIGKIYWRNKRYEEAEEAFKWALKRAEALSDVHLDLGKMYMEWGKYDLARKEFTEVLRFDPTNEEAKALLLEVESKAPGSSGSTTETPETTATSDR